MTDVTNRISIGWKWRELTGVICDKLIPLCLNFMPSSIPHNGAYSCLLRVRMQIFNETDHAFQCMEMMMLRWSMGLMLHDRVRNKTVRGLYRVRPIWDKMAECRLRWYGHCPLDNLVKSNVQSIAHIALGLITLGPRPRGRPKRKWIDNAKANMLGGTTFED